MTWSIEEALTIPDPAWSWAFRCLEFRLTNISTIGASLSAGSSLIDLRYVQGVSLPHPYFDHAPAFREATRTYYPGFNDVNSLSVTFFEDSQYRVHRMLNNWLSLIRNKFGLYSLPKSYKGTMLVAGYPANSGRSAGGTQSPTYVFRVTGLFPTTQPPTDYSYDSNGRLTIPMEFSVDSAEPEELE